jgi:hypothetical protein
MSFASTAVAVRPDGAAGTATELPGVVVHTYQGETSGAQAELPALL